jgi:hypothetical protein
MYTGKMAALRQQQRNEQVAAIGKELLVEKTNRVSVSNRY